MHIVLILGLVTEQTFKNGFDEAIRVLPLAVQDKVSQELDFLRKLEHRNLGFFLEREKRGVHIVLTKVVHDDEQDVPLAYLHFDHCVII